jgi:hypothetical protein
MLEGERALARRLVGVGGRVLVLGLGVSAGGGRRLCVLRLIGCVRGVWIYRDCGWGRCMGCMLSYHAGIYWHLPHGCCCLILLSVMYFLGVSGSQGSERISLPPECDGEALAFRALMDRSSPDKSE